VVHDDALLLVRYNSACPYLNRKSWSVGAGTGGHASAGGGEGVGRDGGGVAGRGDGATVAGLGAAVELGAGTAGFSVAAPACSSRIGALIFFLAWPT
jgi:hypothetical protein